MPKVQYNGSQHTITIPKAIISSKGVKAGDILIPCPPCIADIGFRRYEETEKPKETIKK